MAAEIAFWDSSAVALLVVDQRASATARTLRRAHPRFVVWWGTRVEVHSAIARLQREELLDGVAVEQSTSRLDRILAASIEVEPTDAVRDRAVRLLDAHDLRAADAFQLSAALEWCRDRPRGRPLVCFDAHLAEAARAEGFDVEP